VDDRLAELFHRLRSARFQDIAGTRIVADVPLSDDLVNRFIALSLPATAPVRSVAIHPEAGDRFSVRIAPKAALMPSITLKLAIEEQPRLPESAVLVLRMATLSGLFGLAGAAIGGLLPPGVKLEGERIRLDLRALAAQHGQGELLDHVSHLRITTEEKRIVLHVELAVRGGTPQNSTEPSA
jgi:hypothetical protein